MFGFIKWVGALMDQAKKKKGLWFTLLSVFSLMGIFASLYFVNFLVSDVAKKTYENQKTEFGLRLANQFSMHKERTLAIATALTQNKEIKDIYINLDENSSKDLKFISDQIQRRISRTLDSKNFSVTFKQSEKFTKLKMINGLNVQSNGVKFQAIMPLVKTDSFVSQVVVNEDIESLTEIFKNEKKEFLFMLNKSSINKVDSLVKKSHYAVIFDQYYIKEKAYDISFLESVKGINYQKLKKDGYFKNREYFYVFQKVFDIDGDEIGMAIIAQNMGEDNSFVNLVKNLVNSVTTVALGLIVSMILFLF